MEWISDSGGGRNHNLQQFALPDYHFSFQIHGAHWRTVDKGWFYPDHHHPLIELNIVLEGQQIMTIEGTDYIQSEGDLMIIRQGDNHRSRIGQVPIMTYFCLHLDITDTSFYQRLTSRLPLFHASESNAARRLRPFIDLLVDLSKTSGNGTDDSFVMRSAALNILIVLNDLCAQPSGYSRPESPQREHASDLVQKLRERNELERKVCDIFNEPEAAKIHIDDYMLPPHRWVGMFSLQIADSQFWTKPERFWAKNLLSNTLSELGTVVIVEGERLLSPVTFSNRFTVPALEEYAAKSKLILENNLGVEIRMGFGGMTPIVGELRSLYRQSLRLLGLLDNDESPSSDIEFIGRIIRTAMRCMETEYANPELSLGFLASRLNLTPNYLSSLFTSETGCTFTQHLSRIRVDQAKILLRDSNLKIYQICKQVGYADQAYFSRLFKTIVGLSPNAFRAKNYRE